MTIRDAVPNDQSRWNEFVSANFQPVGAFLQSWEWGEFQQALGYRLRRIVLLDDNNQWLGITLAIRYTLALGFSYYYLPRGPVFSSALWENHNQAKQTLKLIRERLSADDKKCVFIRMEPALENPPQALRQKPFIFPKSYVQPRFNAVINIDKPPEAILAGFDTAMRHNIRKAERNRVQVEAKSELSETEWLEFRKMQQETASRAGKNIYPSEKYFRELIRILPAAVFAAYHNGTLAGINIVIFFSRTATYLFGATRTDKLVFKISPYLTWIAMLESKKRGFAYYDLGGVDQRLWPTLTYFKHQFGGKVISYIGNADAIMKPVLYYTYRYVYPLAKGFLAKMRGRDP